MGADSHPMLERFQKNGWVCIDDKNRYWKIIQANDYNNPESFRPSYINVLGERNYTLFAVLANVRNDNITPLLFAGRGMPKDVSKTVQKAMPLNSDYHSHTYFTVRELMDVDWDKIGMERGEAVLYADQYQSWKETGEIPKDAEDYAYAGERVTEAEMTMRLMSTDVKKLVNYTKTGGGCRVRAGAYVKVPTSYTYRQLVPRLIEVIPDLQKLGDPEKIRIVVSFDS